MTLEDEPAAEPSGPGASGPSGDRPADRPAEPPAEFSAPPPGATSRADKRRNQHRR